MHGFGKKMDSVWYLFCFTFLPRLFTHFFFLHRRRRRCCCCSCKLLSLPFSLTSILSNARCWTQCYIKCETKLRNEKDFSLGLSREVYTIYTHDAQALSKQYKMENPLALISLNTETKVSWTTHHDTCCVFERLSNQYLLQFDIKMALEAFLDQRRKQPTPTETTNERKSERKRAKSEEKEFEFEF